jgi:hypothetical protein
MSLPLPLLPYLTPPYLKVTAAGLVPNASGFVEFLVTGTSTPLATYADSDGNTQNPNPIELNSDGWPDDPIYLQNTGYTVNLYDSDNDPADPGSVPYQSVTFVEDVGSLFAATMGNILAEGSKGVTTSPYVVTADDNLVTVDSATNPFVVQLPAASTRKGPTGNGLPLTIKCLTAISVRVTRAGSDTIDDGLWAGGSYVTVGNGPASITLISDGVSAWFSTGAVGTIT